MRREGYQESRSGRCEERVGRRGMRDKKERREGEVKGKKAQKGE